MKLTDDVVRSFRAAKVFRDDADRFKSFEFSPDGNHIMSSGKDDNHIYIHDCQKADLSETIPTRKYGVGLLRYAHNSDTTAVHSSTRVDHSVRYLSLSNNKYIHYYRGHTEKVVSLCISPVENLIVSGSLDESIRFWDLRSQRCQGCISLIGRPVAAFDPKGLVLAVGLNSERLKLFDIRFFGKGPFTKMMLPQKKDCDWTDLKYSPDGRTILIPTNGTEFTLIKAFSCLPIQTFTGHQNNKRRSVEVSFSPDSQYVFSGSTNGRIHAWNIGTGFKVCALKGDYPVPQYCIKFNPKYMMIASAYKNMSLWFPTLADWTFSNCKRNMNHF